MSFFFKKNFIKNFSKKNKLSRYNILFLIEDLTNEGYCYSVVEYANFCVKNGIGVVIITSNNKIRYLVHKDVFIIKVTKTFFKNVGIIPLYLLISRLIRALKINIICNCCIQFLWFTKFFKKKRTKVAFLIFDVPEMLTRVKALPITFLKDNDFIFAFSYYCYQNLLNNFKLNSSSVYCINQCIDDVFVNNFISPERIKGVLEKIDISIGAKRIIVGLCNYDDIKQILVLLNAIKILKQYEDFVCVLSGTFKKNNYKNVTILLKMIKKLDIESNIRIVDTIYDKSALYSISHFVICLQEGINKFDKVPCEAGAMRKPVVAVNDGEFSRLIVDYKTGFLVRRDDVLDIFRALLRILRMEKKEYNQMCQCAFEYAKTYFCTKNSFIEMDDLFFKAISKSNGVDNKISLLKRKMH